MTEDAMNAGCALGGVLLMIALPIGWVLNVAKIFLSLNDPLTGMFFMRLIGTIVFPIGCIVGWL